MLKVILLFLLLIFKINSIAQTSAPKREAINVVNSEAVGTSVTISSHHSWKPKKTEYLHHVECSNGNYDLNYLPELKEVNFSYKGENFEYKNTILDPLFTRIMLNKSLLIATEFLCQSNRIHVHFQEFNVDGKDI
ncbi:MAG: hypothetical protein K2X50_05450, partial [Gammaproteobacteria bacterium]|nr:hypothetical protein [Gammaproteobacteria bacterium]